MLGPRGVSIDMAQVLSPRSDAEAVTVLEWGKDVQSVADSTSLETGAGQCQPRYDSTSLPRCHGVVVYSFCAKTQRRSALEVCVGGGDPGPGSQVGKTLSERLARTPR